jgi:sugar transferase (PEP-CTERM/EpsH1 system associated)
VRILCLTSRLPYPPDRGDRLRAFHVLQILGREHELTLLSFVEAAGERAHLEQLRAFCRSIQVVEKGRAASLLSVLANCWRSLPLQVLYYRSGAMRSLVEATLREQAFDAAYIHLFRMAPYLPPGRVPCRILDLTDVISSEIRQSLRYRRLPQRAVWGIERRRVERFERIAGASADEVWLISEHERETLADSCPAANIEVVPNGVDCHHFHPVASVEDPATVLLTGHMGVFHNVDAAIHLVEDVLPMIRREVPECRLRLVGAGPCRAVRRLARQPGVEVAGWVPDLNLELNRAAVFVAPIRFAAGVQNKVLEAMAAGRPVVTSPQVAAGIGAVPGRDLLVGENASQLAQLTTGLLRDPSLRQRLGAAGRELVCGRFSWQRVADRARELEDRITAAR